MLARYAVMGSPVAHSLSPTIHQLFAKQTGCALIYDKILIDLPNFERQMNDFFSQGGCGLNITLPCKQRAFAMSEQQTSRCKQARAANTLWRHAGRLHADNTDGIGLMRDLERHVTLSGKRILLLGAGGAARGVLSSLLAARPKLLTIANRTLEKAQALQLDFPDITCQNFENLTGQYDVIINATSASMTDSDLVLPPSVMTTKPFCYDLAYNKTQATPFIAWARSMGCVAVDGLGMLIEQAAEAFFIWHEIMPDTTPILDYFQKNNDGTE